MNHFITRILKQKNFDNSIIFETRHNSIVQRDLVLCFFTLYSVLLPTLHHCLLSLIARKRNYSTQTGIFRDEEKVSKCNCNHHIIKVKTACKILCRKCQLCFCVLTIPLSYLIIVRSGSLDQEISYLTMVVYRSEHAN